MKSMTSNVWSPCDPTWASSFERQFPITYSHISLQNMEENNCTKTSYINEQPIFVPDKNILQVIHNGKDYDDDHNNDHDYDYDDYKTLNSCRVEDTTFSTSYQ